MEKIELVSRVQTKFAIASLLTLCFWLSLKTEWIAMLAQKVQLVDFGMRSYLRTNAKNDENS